MEGDGRERPSAPGRKVSLDAERWEKLERPYTMT